MSIFDEINARADRIKAEKRAHYTPLPRIVWRDTPDRMTLVTLGDTGTRSTYVITDHSSDWHRSTHTIIARPTERMALAAAAGLWHYLDDEPPTPRVVMRRKEKWCDGCQQRKPHSSFARDRRTSDGLSYYCRVCRERIAEARWTRSKMLKFYRVLNSLTLPKPMLR